MRAQEKVDLKLEEEASCDILSALQDRSQSIWSATNCCWCSGLTTVADKVKTLRVRTFIVRTGVWGGKSGHKQIAPGKTSSRFKSFWERKLIFEQKWVFILSEEEHLGKGENQQCYTMQYHTITIPNNTTSFAKSPETPTGELPPWSLTVIFQPQFLSEVLVTPLFGLRRGSIYVNPISGQSNITGSCPPYVTQIDKYK